MTAIILAMDPSRTGRAMARRASDLKAIGWRLVLARTAAGLASGELAARGGIEANTYSNWEGGTNRPRVDQVAQVLPLLSITLDYVFLGDETGMTYEARERIAEAREKLGDQPPEGQRKRGRPKRELENVTSLEFTAKRKNRVA
ncbi:helix-turn-helix domain-containing protein [Roseococcus thiosulfatophilus]|uniref:helix-turn-helix domain-containing protein n=1 Tax=Roseococcus thiosulfatophilus TaxID=35813 RepID=UPI001A9095BD|nr:helix-turn-helix transcriptional regulator [Roseococcus thiosulfatophilus]